MLARAVSCCSPGLLSVAHFCSSDSTTQRREPNLGAYDTAGLGIDWTLASPAVAASFAAAATLGFVAVTPPLVLPNGTYLLISVPLLLMPRSVGWMGQ